MKAKISEIFKSIQGEGVYQGQEQIFVRFFGCNLSCSFCDTRLDYYQEKTIDDVVKNISLLGDCHSVSITGGEPLLQVEFLQDLCRELKKQRKIIYLETNGTLSNSLKRIIEYIDIISMDFKLPSSTKQNDCWKEHREFLAIALKKDVFIKAVIGKDTQISDIGASLKIIKEFDAKLSFVFQPENLYEDELGGKLETFRKFFESNGSYAKVIPQLHKKLGIR